MSGNFGTIELELDAPEYLFSTPAGHRLAHSILRPQLPYDPHDAQLEGICKAVDGINIMVLTPTGSGKTCYLSCSFNEESPSESGDGDGVSD
jgi:ATP-dependent helicase YprA (DUF1998 family)